MKEKKEANSRTARLAGKKKKKKKDTKTPSPICKTRECAKQLLLPPHTFPHCVRNWICLQPTLSLLLRIPFPPFPPPPSSWNCGQHRKSLCEKARKNLKNAHYFLLKMGKVSWREGRKRKITSCLRESTPFPSPEMSSRQAAFRQNVCLSELITR